jgi:hypothetical protein
VNLSGIKDRGSGQRQGIHAVAWSCFTLFLTGDFS